MPHKGRILKAIRGEMPHRLIFMEEGKINEEGAPDRLFDHFREERTGTFWSKVLKESLALLS